MLDVALDQVAFCYRDASVPLEITTRFPADSRTALLGAGGSGKTTLLRLIEGSLRPDSGTIRIGAHDVSRMRPAQRPVTSIGLAAPLPARWSVSHFLVAALRRTKLDRADRLEEMTRLVNEWGLEPFAGRRIATLSRVEHLRLVGAWLELLRPPIVVWDASGSTAPPDARRLTERIHSNFRAHGTTAVAAVGTIEDAGWFDRVVVLDHGRIVAGGPPRTIYSGAETRAGAEAVGDLNIIPVHVRGSLVRSPIAEWELPDAPFQGDGTAWARPEDFTLAAPGEESDFFLPVEEARFVGGRWLVSGMLSGGITLRVFLPYDTRLEKGRLLALRCAVERFRLVPG
ncbi:MAG: ATP-binding cassette domain-containing protein [Thermoanaerobaculia bacterium]